MGKSHLLRSNIPARCCSRRYMSYSVGSYSRSSRQCMVLTRRIERRDWASRCMYYGMTLQHEGKWRGQEPWNIRGLPIIVGPASSEHSQRNIYRYWAKLMG